MTKKGLGLNDRPSVDDAMRHDLLSFTDRCMHELHGGNGMDRGWHLELMASELMAVFQGANRRLLINLPPRHLKSVLCSVAFPAWVLGHNPAAQLICVSYGQDLTEKLGRDCRQVMASTWYKRLFPKTILSSKRNASAEFETTAGGFRLGTSTGGVLTGRGAHFIIIDDPQKAADAYSEAQRSTLNEWYSTTLLSRLNDKATGAVIVVMQRLHEDDLSGVLLEKGGFKHISLAAVATTDETFQIMKLGSARTVGRKAGKALHPRRESVELLQEIRRELGENVFSAQYQQAPIPAEGALIKAGWLKRYTPNERPEKFDLVFQSWDTANKLTDGSDFSVCTTWGVHGKRLYLLHVLRDRMDFPTLRTKAITHRQDYNAQTVLIEDKASGTQLLQELMSSNNYWAKGIEPEGAKLMRMHGQTVLFENGAVLLPTEAAWLADYVRELLGFPNTKHDDQVDSTSQALAWHNPRFRECGVVAYYRKLMEERIVSHHVV